jgi:hypothetical protein
METNLVFYALRIIARAFVLTTFLTFTSVAQPPPPGASDSSATATKAGTKVVDYKVLIPLLPEPPEGWKADPAEGSTDDLGDTEITTVHRDYSKGDGDNVPTCSISILDSAANPEYVESTIAAWNSDTSDAEGYTKALSVEGMPGFETFENDGKHGTLWLMVGKRFFLQIETTMQDPSALQEWLKRIDIKKLAAVK